MDKRFTKLDSKGAELPADATDHVAVRDNITGLTWTAATLGCGTHQLALELAADCRAMGASDWRLPTAEELFALADRNHYNPAIDTTAFPDTRSNWYWSSFAWAADLGYVWFVNFHYGSADFYHLTYSSGFVRAVRGPAASRITLPFHQEPGNANPRSAGPQ